MYSMTIKWDGVEASVRNMTGTLPGLIGWARAAAARLGLPSYMVISREDGSWAFYANGSEAIFRECRPALPLP
jgi:hypothetical protein